MTTDDLERRADLKLGSQHRRLFLMDSDDGMFWIRPDLTGPEGQQVSDTLAALLHRARHGLSIGTGWRALRLYDDGHISER